MRFERSLVYTVRSRRSGGLSVGIDLFPDAKRCSFDCPYCEIFSPLAGSGDFGRAVRPFSRTDLEAELRAELRKLAAAGETVRDVCFSGSGEPTLSADFPAALEVAARLRAEEAPAAKLVVITNGSTLSDPRVADFLASAALPPTRPDGLGLEAWVKLDAGTEVWYRTIDRSFVPFERLIGGIRAFLTRAPAVIQTMLCAVDGAGPSELEAAAWIGLAVEFAALGDGRSNGVRRFDLYGKTRPAPEDPMAAPLSAEALEARAAALQHALRTAIADAATAANRPIPEVRVFP